MKPHARLLLAAAFAVAAVGGGCKSTFKAYPGPERPPEEIARVRGSAAVYFTSSTNTYIQAVDGRRCNDGNGNEKSVDRALVLPGRHTIKAVIWEHRTHPLINIPVHSASPSKNVSFTAEAGHRYVVEGYIDEPDFWIWIVDEATDEVVGGEPAPD